jgi:serine/threonine-protein kinase RsbT
MVIRDAVAEVLETTLMPLLVRSIVATLPTPAADGEVGSLDVISGYNLLRHVAAGARIFSTNPTQSPDLLEALHDRIAGGRPFRPVNQVLSVSSDHDVVAVQDATGRLVRGIFKPTDCVRVLTAVSELARNIYLYAGAGEVRLELAEADRTLTFQVTASDRGPGIARLPEILAGTYRSKSGLGRGLLGAKTLLEDLDIQTSPQGTTIRGVKRIRVSDTMRIS